MAQKENKRMKTQGRTKGWTVLGALLLLGSLFVGSAQAATNDSLTVTITPNAQYIVDIDSNPFAGAWLNLGAVNLGASTWTVRPATVAVQSTYATTELSLQGTPLDDWTLDANTATNEADALKAWAVFTDTGVSNVPAQASGYFSGTVPNVNNSDVIGTANLGVGTGGGLTQFVALPGDAGHKTMENIPSELVDAAASHAHLWLRFTLPPTTTTLTSKRIYLTLTAGAPVP
jgi:hypothetical protein